MRRVLIALICVGQLPAVTWPIKASSNGRYFQDSANIPWLMNCDTDHAIMGYAVSPVDTQYNAYLTSRSGYGFNCTNIFAVSLRLHSSGADGDGNLPFTSGSGASSYDFGTTGNLTSAYWAHVDSFIADAATAGFVVLLDPMPAQYFNCTSSCGTGAADTFGTNGTTKVQALGTALGNRYKNSTNVIWHIGNDCQSCTLSLQKAFLDAITAADPNHLTTFQYSYFRSYTNQVNSASFASEFTVDYVYTYYETYDYCLSAYNSSPTIPTFMGEANYEGGNNTGQLTSVANALITRMQSWWSVTQGCQAGAVWGNESVNHNDSSYPGSLTTTATGEVVNLYNLLTKYQWQSLVPDSGHTVLTSQSVGTAAPNNENLYNANYATLAWVTDGSLAIAYTPVSQTLTIAMSQFARVVTAKWYDPSNGAYTAIGSFANTGSHGFVASGNNHDGNPDWVLLLDATISGGTVSSAIISGGAVIR